MNSAPGPQRAQVHIGCGEHSFPGWVNIDLKQAPGVDLVLDVRQGLPMENVGYIYAEHFLEHLPLADGFRLLAECRRVLAADGVLRLSTPNLDWVLATHYTLGGASDQAIYDCLRLNRAFHGWGHQFLYNGPMLTAAIKSAGFAQISFHRYGQSDRPILRGIERHETWEDELDLPHVLIAEAYGTAEPECLRQDWFEEFQQAIDAR
jgi:predicted SAM-dependent methyltransferase